MNRPNFHSWRRLAPVLLLAGLSGMVAGAVCAQGSAPPPPEASANAAPAGDAVWSPRTLQFTYMGFTAHYSCDGLRDKIRMTLLQLGARASDLKVQPYGCTAAYGRPEHFPGVRAKFFVLQPAGKTPPDAGPPVQAQWQNVDLDLSDTGDPLDHAGQCELVEQIKHSILPLFATRGVDYRQSCIPHQLTPAGTTLRVEVLKPAPKSAATPS